MRRPPLPLSIVAASVVCVSLSAAATGSVQADPRQKALEAFQGDDLTTAERLLEEWLAAHPQDGQTQLLLGMMRVTAAQTLGRQDRPASEVRAIARRALDPLLAAERLAAGRALPDLDHAIGYVLMTDGRFFEAERRLSGALADKPHHPELLRLRGKSRIELGDYAGAEEDLRQAVAARRAEFPTRVLLAEALFLLGRESEARETLREYRASFENRLSEERRFQLAHRIATYSLLMNELDDARAVLEAACSERVGYPPCAGELGRLYYQLGEFEPARQFLEQLERMDDVPVSMRADAIHHLGLIALADGDYPEARRYFETAMKLEPTQGKTLQNYAATLRRLGDDAGARKALARFEALVDLETKLGELRYTAMMNPADRQARVDEIRVLMQLERHAEAQDKLETLRAIAPHHPALAKLNEEVSRGR